MHQLVVVYVYVVFFNFADQLQDNDAVDIRRACFRAASKVLGLVGVDFEFFAQLQLSEWHLKYCFELVGTRIGGTVDHRLLVSEDFRCENHLTVFECLEFGCFGGVVWVS